MNWATYKPLSMSSLHRLAYIISSHSLVPPIRKAHTSQLLSSSFFFPLQPTNQRGEASRDEVPLLPPAVHRHGAEQKLGRLPV